MPVYTCTTTTTTLNEKSKKELAAEITRIHAEINHVPSTYANVVFHELPTGNIFTDSAPASPVLINGGPEMVIPPMKRHSWSSPSPGPAAGSPACLRKTSWWSSRAAPLGSRSRAGECCPSLGRRRPGSPGRPASQPQLLPTTISRR